MLNTIWVISDNPENAYELTSKAKMLGDKLIVYLVGDEAAANNAIGYGADVVKLMSLPQNTIWEQYIDTILKDVEESKPQLILLPETRRSKDLAAQVAARLDCPCVTDSKTLEIQNGKLVLKRIIYGGLANKEMECEVFPLVVTISPRTFQMDEPADRAGEVVHLELAGESPVQLVDRKEKEASAVNLEDAEIVVGVGRGLAKKDGLAMFEELAALLGGEVGCSRPVAEDLQWLPEDRYLGISGKQIKPKLYLCAGVSGQIQHVYGVRESKTIVSIDKNENAPIFKVSDYYVVGDLEEMIPALIKELK